MDRMYNPGMRILTLGAVMIGLLVALAWVQGRPDRIARADAREFIETTKALNQSLAVVTDADTARAHAPELRERYAAYSRVYSRLQQPDPARNVAMYVRGLEPDQQAETNRFIAEYTRVNRDPAIAAQLIGVFAK